MKVKVTVDDVDHELDLSFDRLTLRESVAVEDALGPDGWDRLASGRVTPKGLQAMVWAKLRGEFPDIALDDFDLDFMGAADAVAGGGEDAPFDNPS